MAELSALDRASTWLNSEPLTEDGLRGRVVLVDFWTYSCVNWLRTLPYVRAWHERYRERGLVVVGAHAPEFGFEHDLDNVRHAIAELDVGYPVVIDNDFAIWRAFGNQYWPALYLLDGKGRVRRRHFGEGEYADIEKEIQQLLIEAGARNVDRQISSVAGRGIEAAADWPMGPPTGGRPVAVSRAARRTDAGFVARRRSRRPGNGRRQ